MTITFGLKLAVSRIAELLVDILLIGASSIVRLRVQLCIVYLVIV